MLSIIKIAIKNILSKKGRSLMLLVGVVFSAALVYTALSMTTMVEDVFTNSFIKEYGNTDIVVMNSDSSFIEEEIEIDMDRVDYAIEGYDLYGYTYQDEDLVVNIKGIGITNFETIYDGTYLDYDKNEFTGNSIIIGEKNSEKYNLFVGDTLSVSISGIQVDFVIHSITEEGDSFLDISPNIIDIVCDTEYLEAALELSNTNMYLISTDDPLLAIDLQETYPDMAIEDINQNDDLLGMVRQITILLSVIASSVILISAFIIYSTYKMIVIERMPYIGTLRSIGATKTKTTIAMIIESIIYGIVGGFLGIGLGIIFLMLMVTSVFGEMGLTMDNLQYLNISYLVITILLSTLLTVGSSLVPIIKAQNYSIKQIMFGEIKTDKHLPIIKPIIGIGLIIIGYLIIMLTPVSFEENALIISTLLVSIGSIMMIPIFIHVFTPVVSVLFRPIFKNTADISIKSIKNDKMLINNIVLLATGLGIIFAINSFSSTVADTVVDVYNKAEFDVMIMGGEVNDEFIDVINEVDGVENVYATKVHLNVETDQGFDLMYVEGIELASYKEYGWDEFNGLVDDDLITTFNSTDSIIITDFTSRKYDLDIGDEIVIKSDSSNISLTVIETIPSVLNNGNMNFISTDIYDSLFDENYYQFTYIEVDGDSNEIKKEIKEQYQFGVLPIVSLDEMETNNQEGNAQLFGLLRGISIITMLIGAIGVINNFMVSFISRRRLIASLRSLGLSKKGTVKLFMVESLICGTIGSLIGVVFGLILYRFMGFLVETINITSEVMTYSINEVIFTIVCGILISVGAAVIPTITMANKNIVSEIKYE